MKIYVFKGAVGKNKHLIYFRRPLRAKRLPRKGSKYVKITLLSL